MSSGSTDAVTGVTVRCVVRGSTLPSDCVSPGCNCSRNPCVRTWSAQWCGSTRRSSGAVSSVATASSGPTGAPTTRSPSIPPMCSTSARVDASVDAASAANPSRPSACTIAQAAASAPADLDPSIVAFTTGYPGQRVVAKYCARWRSRPRCSSTDAPFGA